MSRDDGDETIVHHTSMAPSPYAFIGLGNPGLEYANTRHNIGFKVIEMWLKRLRLQLTPICREFEAAMTEIDRRDVLFIKPMTFMNRSGRAVVEAMRRYNLRMDHIVVICDDVNLPFGKLRLRGRGRDGGHNGLASIIASLGTTEFARQRLGVSLPSPETDMIDHVLGDFTDEENEALHNLIERACLQLQTLLVDGLAMATSRYNG